MLSSKQRHEDFIREIQSPLNPSQPQSGTRKLSKEPETRDELLSYLEAAFDDLFGDEDDD